MQPKATPGSMRSLLHERQNPWRTLFQRHHHHRQQQQHRYHVHTRCCGPVRVTYSVTTAVVLFATAAAVRYYQKSGNDHLYRLVVCPYTTSTLPLPHSFVVARSRNIPTTCCEQTSQPSLRSDGQHPASTVSTTTATITTTTTKTATTKTTTIPIPEPPQRHVILPPPPPTATASPSRPRSGIFVMGDVHGCYDEMMQLYQQAVIQNGHCDFHYVILVGDICNKGPQSMAVIRHMRQHSQDHWICIRGNHENAVLRAYLEMNATTTTTTTASPQPDATTHTRYHWLLGTEATVSDDDDHDSDTTTTTTTTTTAPPFTQDDFEWMSRLPYTIRIPASHIGLQPDDEDDDKNNDNDDHDRAADHNNITTDMVVTQSSSRNGDVVIVHAGLRPELPIEENDIPTMVVLRELDDARKTPWAQVWEGPELVIFGHDAKRGLQLERHAIGLDTGCVYGNQLTGLILPSRTMVQVPALRPHVPVVERSQIVFSSI